MFMGWFWEHEKTLHQDDPNGAHLAFCPAVFLRNGSVVVVQRAQRGRAGQGHRQSIGDVLLEPQRPKCWTQGMFLTRSIASGI